MLINTNQQSGNKNPFTHPLSRKTNTIIPAQISSSKMITKNTEYYKNGEEKVIDWHDSFFWHWCWCCMQTKWWFSCNKFTIDKRQVFSRSAPTQPVNPMMNVTVPAKIRRKAGSRAMWLPFVKFRNISFSFHAQTPTANMHIPANYFPFEIVHAPTMYIHTQYTVREIKTKKKQEKK